MEIICENCNTKINVPDEKIPKGKAFSFNCPSCKGKVTISSKDPITKNAAAPAVFSAGSKQPGAMICHTESKLLKGMVEKMGYQLHAPTSHKEANSILRFNSYRLIIITEEFEKVPHDGPSILETLQAATMDKRRKIFVLYIGSNVKSFDSMQAFAMSVNAVISSDDFVKKGEQLAEAITGLTNEYGISYKVFFEEMEKLGKSA